MSEDSYNIPSNTRYDVERDDYAEELDPVDWSKQSAQDPRSAAKKKVFERIISGAWEPGDYTMHVHHDGERETFTVCSQPTIDVWIDD